MTKNVSASGFPINEQRNWALFHHMHQLHELIIKELDQRLENTGLTFSQTLVLLSIHTLRRHPELGLGRIAQTNIAKILLCREATISRHIKKLSELGLLTVVEDKKRRSANQITLTEKGKRHLRDGFHVINGALSQFFGEISPSKKNSVFKQIEHIVVSIDPKQKLMCEQQVVRP